MAPPRWASQPQYDFLRERRGEFQQFQKAKNLPTFWTNIMRDWFYRWPGETQQIGSGENGEDVVPDDSDTTRKVRSLIIINRQSRQSHSDFRE